MVRILSIDVGVRNLGACEIEHETGGDAIKIGFWGVIVNPRESDSVQAAIAGAVDAVRELDSLSGGFGWDHVLVENQPCMKNPRMKAVQTALHAMLVATYGEGVDVRMAGAAGKNRIADEILGDRPATPGYRANKRRAVDAARAFLAARGMKDDLAALDASGKKDDMCDALLQGLFFMSYRMKILRVKTEQPDAPTRRRMQLQPGGADTGRERGQRQRHGGRHGRAPVSAAEHADGRRLVVQRGAQDGDTGKHGRRREEEDGAEDGAEDAEEDAEEDAGGAQEEEAG